MPSPQASPAPPSARFEGQSLRRLVRTLRCREGMDETDLLEVLVRVLACTSDRAGSAYLLAEAPEAHGGLQQIATCLLHPNEKIRDTAGAILRRCENGTDETRSAVSSLNLHLLSAFERMMRRRRTRRDERAGGQ